MRGPIGIPHLKIKKMVADPDHTKLVIIYLCEQLFRMHKQQSNIDWCIVIKRNGGDYIVQQPVIPNSDISPDFIWSMFFQRSIAIRQYVWGLHTPKMRLLFGDDPEQVQIVLTIDGKNYDFDAVAPDVAGWIRSRIDEANMWIWEFQRLRNIELRKRNEIELTDADTWKTFEGPGMLLQLHLVDCLYESTKRQIGEKMLERIRKKLFNV